MIVDLDEAKEYLRVDSPDDDGLITGLISSAERLALDIGRVDEDTLSDDPFDEKTQRLKEILRVAVLYTVSYLYEHREDADMHALNMTLRSLLFSVREGVF